MKQTTIQLGGAFEATVTETSATFNQPVTVLGMHYVNQIAAEMERLKSENNLETNN